MRALRPAIALVSVATVLLACGIGERRITPSIEFTTIPAAAAGGSDRRARVSGRAIGAGPGHHIVLYARSGVWWVQPLTAEPFTKIAADASWENTIHLGTEYAALLVDAQFRPAPTLETLPKQGGSVLAVATIKGAGEVTARPANMLSFSGYEWEVRQIGSDRGGSNEYDASNAWTDAEGFLHLRLARREERWTSAEVILTRTLGYGTYAFTVRDISSLDPSAAFGMLTWDDQGAEQNHREMDIEISQWGDRSIPNAQFVLQPYYVPANVVRFAAPAGTLTHSFRWEPGRAWFKTVRGRNAAAGGLIAQHEFTSGVPTPGTERVRINLYYFRYSPQPPKQDVEVVLERFQYLP